MVLVCPVDDEVVVLGVGEVALFDLGKSDQISAKVLLSAFVA